VIAPGVVKHIDGDKFGLGEPNRAKTERTEKLSQLFSSAGLKAPILPEIRNDIWLKLWGNLCFNPISVLTRATLDIVATDPGTRALSRNMMLEAERIGRRIGVHFRVDVERRINGAARVGAHRTSMLQDLERGRPLELDAMLTSVQEIGRLVELETPHIDAVLALAQQLGRTMGLYPTFPEDMSQRVVDEARVD
jgi:2-dehydropantoate 2-reductase